jgi:hypothetical protein
MSESPVQTSHEYTGAGTRVLRRAGGLILLLIVLLAGCASTPGAYVRDGVAYGTTEGPFRGRWWSYYERGRSFLDGGFYAEAERDFATALKERDRDQRWARTYGLHFTPQYFPNREFGVARYFQADFAGAIAALDRSYAHQPSARAACYLRLAREALSRGDTAPPALDVSVPSEGSVATRTVAVGIVASDPAYIAGLAAGGVPVDVGAPVPEIQRVAMVPIRSGINEIVVQATDVVGNLTEKRVLVAGDFDGPVISFDEPIAIPGDITGLLRDPSGIQSLSIGGVTADLDTDGAGTARFQVRIGRDDLKPPLRYTALDHLGNTATGQVPVASVQVAELPSGLVLASAPATVELRGNLRALYWGAQLVAIAQMAPANDTPEVRFLNIEEGQRYLMDEIVVDMEITAPNGIARLTLNDAPVDFLPGRTRQRVSRRLPLTAEGPAPLLAILEEPGGARHESRVTVERALTEVESISRRLSLAMLGNIWEGPNRGEAAEEVFVADELTRRLYEQRRFDLVTREQLPQVLTEQELAAAVHGRNGVSPLRDVVTAELMLVGMVRRDAETIEIILQAISPETSQLMGYADVAGVVGTKDDLRALVGDLALRLSQEFPRVQGRVVDLRSATTLLSDLARPDRIRSQMPCIVFRQGAPIVHPITGATLGSPTEIIAEGRIDEVADALSVIEIDRATENESRSVEVQDFVITK